MKANFFTYIITYKDNSISSVCRKLFNSISEAEREAFSEFDFGKNSIVQYTISKIDQYSDEIIYGVYAHDYREWLLHYKIHILPMEIAQDD